MAPREFDLATIVRDAGSEFLKTRSTTPYQRKALRAIEQCRTPALGGQFARCDRCGEQHLLFRSCGSRSCPRCQASARHDWLAARLKDLLPVPYFHVVFTVPEQLNVLALYCPEAFYGALLGAAGQALLDVGQTKLHAELGALTVLHTWGQNLSLHPHVHCVVPGGGFRGDRKAWVSVEKPTFFLPVKVLSRRFRTLLRLRLLKAFRAGKLARLPRAVAWDQPSFELLLARAGHTDWVVYSKPPFAGPQQVLEYLAAYTHRLAISNRRLVGFDGKTVAFRWKDYRDENRPKILELDVLEFLRRFTLHILPPRLVRIRYFGFLANRNRVKNIELARTLIGGEPIELRSPRERPSVPCPACAEGTLIIGPFWLPQLLPTPARDPPALEEAS